MWTLLIITQQSVLPLLAIIAVKSGSLNIARQLNPHIYIVSRMYIHLNFVTKEME